MIELLALYQWALFSGVLSATALALLGSHLASRDQSLQSLSVSQAATVGVLLSAALLVGHDAEHTDNLLPIIGGIILATTVFFFGERLVANRRTAKTSVFLVMFTVLLALSYWIISYFPALEGHMAQAFFGDLVTLSGTAMWISSVISLLALLLLLRYWNVFANDSFNIPIIGVAYLNGKISLYAFNAISLLLITSSIYSLGLLFTIACLFLPTVIFSYVQQPSLRLHLLLVIILAAVSTVCGFIMTLYFDRFPTVPTVVLVMLFLGLLLLMLVNLFYSKKNSCE